MRAQRGYTLIEVMVSLAVMTIGAMGVVALQHATVAGNRQGREMSTAVHVAETWLERVREDALRWQAEGPPGLVNTVYLNNAPAGVATPGDWFTPVPVIPGRFASADYFGRDSGVAADMVFCSQLRLHWVAGQSALRVDVRTWWAKTGSASSDQTSVDLRPFAGCAAANVTVDLDSATPRLHAVYGSTVVRWNRP